MSTHNDPQRDPPRTNQPHAAEPDTFERCLHCGMFFDSNLPGPRCPACNAPRCEGCGDG